VVAVLRLVRRWLRDSPLVAAIGPDRARRLRHVIPQPLCIAEPPIDLLDQCAHGIVLPIIHGHWG